MNVISWLNLFLFTYVNPDGIGCLTYPSKQKLLHHNLWLKPVKGIFAG